MKKHECHEAERLAGRFHRVMGWTAYGIAALSLFYGLGMLAQGRWHIRGAREHEDEIDQVERRIQRVSRAVAQEHQHSIPN